MSFVDTLLTKKEFEETQLELFNKIWFGDLKEEILKCIQNNVYVTENKNKLFIFDEVFGFDFCDLYEYFDYSFSDLSYMCLLKGIRSKLWNIGFNIVVDSNTTLYIKFRDKEKYSDCFVFYDTNNIQSLKDLVMLSEFSGLTIDEVKKVFQNNTTSLNDNVLKDNNASKKKRSRKKKEKQNDALNGLTIMPNDMVTPISFDSFQYSTSPLQNTNNDIVTLHNNYNENTFVSVDKDEIL